MIGYIYKTTNRVNGKIYIGQHIAQKFEPNKYIGSGSIFLKALAKYGFDAFTCELLATADTVDELNELEKIYIKRLNAKNPEVGYNVCDGGKGGNLGYKFTEEQKRQLSESHKGHRQSPEAIRKQAEACRGRVTITNGQQIKLIPKEELEEYFAAGWYKGRPVYSRSKKVVCYETGEEFSSMNAVLYKYPQAGALKRCVKSAYSSTCCGYHWYLADDIERYNWLKENIKI